MAELGISKWHCIIVAACLACPALAFAQDEEETEPEVRETEVLGTPIEERQHIDERPQPPGGVTLRDGVQVERGAGVGSPIAYASQGVVELGGAIAITRVSSRTLIRLAPSIGYFFVDNFQLTLFPEFIWTRQFGTTDWSLGAIVEPSYHLPLMDQLLVFAGLGVGFRYEHGPGRAPFIFRPRLGLDVLIGRSGILKPAGFIEVGSADGLQAGGFEASYTIMW